jgi:hypothetical protein
MVSCFIVLCFSFLCFSFQALAFQRDILRGHSSGGEPVQWTLADWLAQKNRMSLLDQWLAVHQSNQWFELYGGANSGRFTVRNSGNSGTASVTRDSQTYSLNMYVSILNLFGEYEKTSDNRESYGGGAGLRLLGTSARTTSLAVRYGWRRLQDLDDGEVWDDQFADAQLQLYLFKPFGLTGGYRYYFPTDSNHGNGLQGQRVTAGAFFEFLIFRLYGNYYQEPMRVTPAGGTTYTETRQGFDGGVQLYF